MKIAMMRVIQSKKTGVKQLEKAAPNSPFVCRTFNEPRSAVVGVVPANVTDLRLSGRVGHLLAVDPLHRLLDVCDGPRQEEGLGEDLLVEPR